MATPSGSRIKLPAASWGDVSTAVGAIVAATGLVYSLGGAVIAARLSLYHLPVEAVVTELPHDDLLTVGLIEVVFPALVVGAFYVLCRFLFAGSFLESRLLESTKHLPAAIRPQNATGLGVQLFIFAMGTWLVIGLVRGMTPGYQWQGADWGITVLLTVIGAALATGMSIRLALVQRPHTDAPLALSVFLMAGFVALSVAALWFYDAAKLPLMNVVVCSNASSGNAARAQLSGLLVGTSSNSVYVAEGPSRARYIASMPLSDVRVMYISTSSTPGACT